MHTRQLMHQGLGRQLEKKISHKNHLKTTTHAQRSHLASVFSAAHQSYIELWFRKSIKIYVCLCVYVYIGYFKFRAHITCRYEGNRRNIGRASELWSESVSERGSGRGRGQKSARRSR